tara:strand:+ start:161 stop:649 length:489 start_codon:yes stop_codon:yes gene_type:complete
MQGYSESNNAIIPHVSSLSVLPKSSKEEHVKVFWGSGLSKCQIDPEAEQKIKEKYMQKIEWWKSPEGSYLRPKGIDITKFKIVPIGKIDKYGCGLILYRVYYGKKLYDEYSNDSHMCNLNPGGRNCEFCHMPEDHKCCGYSCHKEGRFDKFLDKLRPKCPYS